MATCKECGREFEFTRKAGFCSTECWIDYHGKRWKEREKAKEDRLERLEKLVAYYECRYGPSTELGECSVKSCRVEASETFTWEGRVYPLCSRHFKFAELMPTLTVNELIGKGV